MILGWIVYVGLGAFVLLLLILLFSGGGGGDSGGDGGAGYGSQGGID
ncbi:hypothetical protein AB3N02_21685 [Priestia aryabhattai]